MKQDRHIQRDFENCHSRCHENSGTFYYWNIVLYLAAKVLFLHEFCCSRQFVKISPSLIHIHVKNDLVVTGGNEAVRVAVIPALQGHVHRKQPTVSAHFHFSQHTVSVAKRFASLFHFGCKDQRQEAQRIPHSNSKKKNTSVLL